MAAESKRPRRDAKVAANVDQTNWRVKVRNASKIKFDDDAKRRFIEHFAKHNRKTHACKAAGVCLQTVDIHYEKDPEFAAAYDAAIVEYRDRIMEHAEDLMINGVKTPIIGGKDRDEVVGHKIEYPVNLLAMEMRRVEPGFKDRSEVDLKGGGGVLVVPANAAADEWTKIVEGQNAQTVQPDPPEAAQ